MKPLLKPPRPSPDRVPSCIIQGCGGPFEFSEMFRFAFGEHIHVPYSHVIRIRWLS